MAAISISLLRWQQATAAVTASSRALNAILQFRSAGLPGGHRPADQQHCYNVKAWRADGPLFPPFTEKYHTSCAIHAKAAAFVT
jgi:hypothetical protein